MASIATKHRQTLLPWYETFLQWKWGAACLVMKYRSASHSVIRSFGHSVGQGGLVSVSAKNEELFPLFDLGQGISSSPGGIPHLPSAVKRFIIQFSAIEFRFIYTELARSGIEHAQFTKSPTDQGTD